MSKQNFLNDNELVQRFISGDQNALEILIHRHKNRVFSYILLIVKKQELAEDIFQETFIKVIRSLKKGKYTDNGKFISWVLRISHNLIIDHFRKEKLKGMISNMMRGFGDNFVEATLASLQEDTDVDWRPRVPQWPAIGDTMATAIQSALSGQATVKAALDDAQKRIEPMMRG